MLAHHPPYSITGMEWPILAALFGLLSLVYAQEEKKTPEQKAFQTRMDMTHGILMGLAFVIFFPLGGLTIRLFSFRGLIWVHAASQIFAYSLALAGFGIGIWLAIHTHNWNPDNGHTAIGIILIGLLIIQPILGLIHHAIYKRSGTRTFYALMHLWLGRILITIGIINGGLGLQLAGDTDSPAIGYGVVAGCVALVYVIVATFASRRKRMTDGEKLAMGSWEPSTRT